MIFKILDNAIFIANIAIFIGVFIFIIRKIRKQIKNGTLLNNVIKYTCLIIFWAALGLAVYYIMPKLFILVGIFFLLNIYSSFKSHSKHLSWSEKEQESLKIYGDIYHADWIN